MKSDLILLKKFLRKIEVFTSHGKERSSEEKFFSNVVGYPEIKKLLLRSTVSKVPIHVLLTGPPSSSKTGFLLDILQGLDDTYFIDAVGSSGAGIVDYLFKNNTNIS